MADRTVGHPGRYDDLAIRLLDETKAEAVVLLVLGGAKGNGFSCSVNPGVEIGHADIPDFLRGLADAIQLQGHPDGMRLTPL